MGGRSRGHEQDEQEHECQRSHQRVSRTVRITLRRFPLRSLIPIDTCARRPMSERSRRRSLRVKPKLVTVNTPGVSRVANPKPMLWPAIRSEVVTCPASLERIRSGTRWSSSARTEIRRGVATLTFGAVWSSGTLPTEVNVVSRRAKLWKPSARGGREAPGRACRW